MGVLYSIWKQDTDPDDAVNPYTPYSFVPAGHSAPINMTMGRDWGRRESVQAIPGMDSVLDEYGREPGPQDRRDMPFGFRVFTNGDNDAAYDLLAAQVAPGYPVRLVYKTDSGALWFTNGSNPRIQQTETSAGNWGHGGFIDFTVTWRIRPDWRLRFSQASDVWGYGDGVWGTADGTWGSAYVVPLSAASVSFTLDNTGTAGSDLPALPDRGPAITITGGTDGFGGDGGILIFNGTATRPDLSGVRTGYNMVVPKVPAGQEMVMDCARQRFTLAGVPFRPLKDAWQREYFVVKQGVVNNCSISALGSNQVFGASAGLLVDWWKKKA